LKRVVIIDGSVAVTGAFIAALNIAEALRPFARTSLVLPSGSAIRAEDFADTCDIVYMPLAKIKWQLKSIATFVPLTLYSGFLLRLLLHRSRCHALLINDFYLAVGPVMRLLGFTRTIVTWVRIDPTVFGRMLSRILLTGAFISSDRIVAVSDFIRGKLPRSPKIMKIYDALPFRQVSLDHVSRVHPGGYRRRIVYIGNYIQGKGQDHAIAAFADLALKYSDVELLFFGGDMGLQKNKEYRLGLEDEVRSKHLQGQIRFHDFVKNTVPVLATASLALNFSERESFSFTCLEASGFGLPMVVTRSGGPEEIIVDGQTGILVAPGDTSAMRDAIDLLLADKTLAEWMGSNAARHVKEKFSFDQFAGDITSILGLI
jgi:glycosyltransferase involved in cell wall biosynthesis